MIFLDDDDFSLLNLFLHRLDSEQRLIEEQALRQSAAKLTIDKNNQVSCSFVASIHFEVSLKIVIDFFFFIPGGPYH